MFDRLRRAFARIGTFGTAALGLLIWEVGARIGLPGLDPAVLAGLKGSGGGGLLGLYDLINGGAFARGGLLALGIVPYFSARIMMRLMRIASPKLEEMWADRLGRAQLREWTRRLTVGLAAVQAVGFARFAQSLGAAPSGAEFVGTTVLALAAGTMLVMLVSEQVSGVGKEDGLSETELDAPDVAPEALTTGPAVEIRTQAEREPVNTRTP